MTTLRVLQGALLTSTANSQPSWGGCYSQFQNSPPSFGSLRLGVTCRLDRRAATSATTTVSVSFGDRPRSLPETAATADQCFEVGRLCMLLQVFAVFCTLTFNPRSAKWRNKLERGRPSLCLPGASSRMLVSRRMPCPVRMRARWGSLKLVNQVIARHQARQ